LNPQEQVLCACAACPLFPSPIMGNPYGIVSIADSSPIRHRFTADSPSIHRRFTIDPSPIHHRSVVDSSRNSGHPQGAPLP
jgi:hypothetical protein